jgi:penicillin-binding protein 1A
MCGTSAFVFGFVTAIASDIPSIDPANAENRVAARQNGYIYASDGKTVLAVLRGDEARVVVDSKDIAPIMKQAIVAVEDRRFWEHRGVDLRGITRAIWSDIRNKELVQGGSTITQQLVKNTYIKPERTVSRKLKEAALAWQIERSWSKDRILTAYLNTIYFGNGAYGIEMASRVYFDKRASELTLPEATLLAGIPASPTDYDPVANPIRAKARRDTVLGLMLAQGLITTQQYQRALDTQLPSPENVGLPGTSGPAKYFTEYVKSQLIPYYGSGKVLGGGLKVYTTIDLELQRIARESIDKWLTDPEGPQAALVAIDPRDGAILAMIGGTSFAKEQFNLAVHGTRQPGSSFKPFVLAAALDAGISPATTYVSKPQVIPLGDRLWAINNYENRYLGAIDLEAATIYSDNTVYAQLTAALGPDNVVSMAHKLGIQSPLDNFLAIGLGVEAVNPLEMARAFATFASGGERMDGALLGNVPRSVTEIRDGDEVLVNAPSPRRVLDESSAQIVSSILQQVVTAGTGQRAALDDRPVAGKTGTTENYGDAWFVGYTPQLAVAIWVGYPDRLEPMTTEFNGKPVAGGTFPALIFKTFAKNALEYLEEPPVSFDAPSYPYSAPVQVTFRDGAWKRDNGNCSHVETFMFFSGSEPSATADCAEFEVEVPDVTGRTLDAAEDVLAGQRLNWQVVYQAARQGELPGKVVNQDPRDGLLGRLETVILFVTTKASNQAVVPDLVGRPLGEAITELEALDLGWDLQESSDVVDARVVAQNPAAGTISIVGADVAIQVAPT